MSAPASRRGFLRDLVGLPLIGGGLTIIGAPSAVALEPTPLTMRTYLTWLQRERARTMAEMFPGCREPFGVEVSNPGWWWHEAKEGLAALPPSSRACLVLSAVGCWEARA